MTAAGLDAGGHPADGPSSFHRALESLREAGIAFTLRKTGPAGAELREQGELDIWLDPRDVRAADAALLRSGFHHFQARGHESHRYYLSLDHGRWLKLDAKLGARNPEGMRPADLRVSMGRLGTGLARRQPASFRRLGPLVAILGPDGAGKGTVVAGLQRSIPVAVKPIYLGHRPRRRPSAPDSRARRRPGVAREIAFVLRNGLRDWARLLPAYLAAWRGAIVLFDRHPIEVLAVRPERRRPTMALERFVAGRLTPRPDAVIVLDAPGEILYGRKGEHSAEVLERWRRSYAEVFVPFGATVIPTTEAPEVVVAQASAVVWEALRRRRAW